MMKNRKHKTVIGKYCCHLTKWFVVNILCINIIPCKICKKEIKDKYNNEIINRI
jgi:hypothetical protein